MFLGTGAARASCRSIINIVDGMGWTCECGFALKDILHFHIHLPPLVIILPHSWADRWLLHFG